MYKYIHLQLYEEYTGRSSSVLELFIHACFMVWFGRGCQLALTAISQTRTSCWTQENTDFECIENI